MGRVYIGRQVGLKSTRFRFDPARGKLTLRTYAGSEAGVWGIIRNLSADQEWELDDSEDPLYQVTVTTPDDDSSSTSEEFINTWELLGNDIQRDLYEHPAALSLPLAVIIKIKGLVQSVPDEDNPTTAYADARTAIGTANTAASGSAAQLAIALSLFDLVLKGTSNYVVSQYVLRKTQTVSSRYQTKVAFSNIERIHTTAQVLATEAVPSTLIFSIDQIPAPTVETGYVWGWLKKTPTVNQQGQKFQITQEYWLEQWSTLLYTIA